jgi:hypothetical protein
MDTALGTIEAPLCRICMSGGHLISPCHCKGSMKYAHDHCLTTWYAYKQGNRNHPLTIYNVVYRLICGSSEKGTFKCDVCGEQMIFMIDGKPIRKTISLIVSFLSSFVILIIPLIAIGFMASFCTKLVSLMSFNENAIAIILTLGTSRPTKCYEKLSTYKLDRYEDIVIMYIDNELMCLPVNHTLVNDVSIVDAFIDYVKNQNILYRKQKVLERYRKGVHRYWQKRLDLELTLPVLLDYFFFFITIMYGLEVCEHHNTRVMIIRMLLRIITMMLQPMVMTLVFARYDIDSILNKLCIVNWFIMSMSNQDRLFIWCIGIQPFLTYLAPLTTFFGIYGEFWYRLYECAMQNRFRDALKVILMGDIDGTSGVHFVNKH